MINKYDWAVEDIFSSISDWQKEYDNVLNEIDFDDEMAKAVYMSAFKGDNNNCLNPDSKITRQEAFIVLFRIFDLAE